MHRLCLILIFIFVECSFAQTITGVVLDAKTKHPIENASVYFDNTTIGTSTDLNGTFEIEGNQSIKTVLVISFLGYETVKISDYKSNKFYKVLMSEEENLLDEVVVNANEGMSYERKLAEFNREFLGTTPNGKSCKILNESDLRLRFNKKTRQLIVNSKRPIKVRNSNLGYLITYDVRNFTLDYSYVNSESETYTVRSMYYEGTSFYESVISEDSTGILDLREKTYKGSILHFMRSLRDTVLEENNYQVFRKGFLVKPDKYIQVRQEPNSDMVKVKLKLPLSILYKGEHQSGLRKTSKNRFNKQLKTRDQTIVINSQGSESNQSYFNTEIKIDNYGNFSPPNVFGFIGYMGTLRVGDTLPLDYLLN